MHRPTNRRHFADLVAIASAFASIPPSLLKGFDPRVAFQRAQKRVARFYGGGHRPHQGERERLRRRVGGFARLHEHGAFGPCPLCDQGKTHKQAAEARYG